MEFEILSIEEQKNNEEAKNMLIPGKYYDFKPAVIATGIPIGGPNVCKPTELTFDKGWYLGFQKGKHIFQGKPVNDPRSIDNLRECYFVVDFTGGSAVTVSDNQSHK